VIHSKTLRRALLGAAAGFSYGYAAVRAAQALRDRRFPYPALRERTPRRYGDTRRVLMLVGIARGVASLAVTAFVDGDALERALRRLPRPLHAPAFALSVAAIDGLMNLGVEYVEDHVLERTYGTSEQNAGGWLGDRAKSAAVGGVVTSILVALLEAIVRRTPRRWPWVAIAATPPLLAFATVIAPTFVMPLFNRYEPVTGELETAIRNLAERYGVGNASILSFDMSRQTKKANAFVTGVLGTERIALGDTLVSSFPRDETLFVVAHELGHYVRRDPWVGIALSSVAIAATVLVSDALLRKTTSRGLTSPAQGARLAFYATIIQLVLGPIANAASRAMERRADRFALAATKDRAAGIRAFVRLAEQNLAELDPPRWAELLFSSHPSLASRINTLEGATD
jgi:STE24 endopeptidase